MKSFFRNRAPATAICLFLLLACSGSVSAQTITTTQPISFGTIAIRDTSTVAVITIDTNGTGITNGNAYFLVDPTRGEYQITGAPPNSFYTVTLPPSTTLTGPGGTFTFDNFTVRPTTLFTNSVGEHTFYIGGRLSTQGGGTIYGDGSYDTTFPVTVAF